MWVSFFIFTALLVAEVVGKKIKLITRVLEKGGLSHLVPAVMRVKLSLASCGREHWRVGCKIQTGTAMEGKG